MELPELLNNPLLQPCNRVNLGKRIRGCFESSFRIDKDFPGQKFGIRIFA